MKPVRFGVVGLGGMGQIHCKSVKSGADTQLTAICDADPTTAETIGHEHGVPFFTDWRALIRSGHCEAVLVATPHPLHPPIAIAALQAGLPVLCEKPLAERVSAADRMIRAARRHRKPLGVMLQRRTAPAFAKAAELVRAGALGRIQRTALIAPVYRTQRYYDSATWRATWKGEGGGVLLNQAPHIIDLLLLLGGRPSTVYGRTATRLHRIEVEDVGEALLSYPDGGSGYLYCSTNEPAIAEALEVVGDRGRLTYRDGRLKVETFTPALTAFTYAAPAVWSAPATAELPVDAPVSEGDQSLVIQNFARHGCANR
jgi:predicted dehydrogenase